MRDDVNTRPRGKVALLCLMPGCGWQQYLDPLDPRLPSSPDILCSFCTGEERICACTYAEDAGCPGGRPIVKGRDTPCSNCGRVGEWWDHVNERVARRVCN